jgi:DNA polymerase-3 subunit alpha
MLSQIRHTVTQKGKSRGERMAMLSLEDLTGKCDAVLFPGDFAKNESLVRDESVVFVRGRLNLRREPPSIAVSEIIPLDEAPLRLTESVVLTLEERRQERDAMQELRRILSDHPGNCGVFLHLVAADGSATTVRADSSFSVTPDAALRGDLEEFLGEGHLTFTAVGPRRRRARNGGRNWHRN